MINIIYFFLGAIFGSFAHLLCDRTLRGENIAYPPSHCSFCNNKILKRDLIPIFSYINLKARCRFCQKKIPFSYIIYEIIGGLLFIFAMKEKTFMEGSLIFLSLIFSFVIAMIDLKSMEIYMGYVYILAFIGLIYRIFYLGFDFKFFKIFLIFTFLYFLIYFISKKNIGDGDYFFYLALFLFLKNERILYLILGSIWIGAIFAIIIAIKKKSMKIMIPFCIYIFIAYIISLL
ncbi:MAG: prepilin peptidase [Anaerococcus vaginalis]|uniref:prepilin peptidase n=1 Tax=Anaerococcus vaginalis TaxID=33037 RepID=UPI0029147F67|nr:prepilin peptidase [Anaerococcus vaginalis]MDU7649797.1 prepilin peptidase [Anaerococcus vaginalis]